MLASKPDENGLGNNGDTVTADLNTYQRQSPVVKEKVALPLKDVQNENRGPLKSCSEKPTNLEERANGDSIQVAGSKRIVPECPPSLPSSQVSNSTNSVAGNTNEVDKIRKTQDTSFKNGTGSQFAQISPKEISQPRKQVRRQDINFGPVFAPIMPGSATPLMNFSSASPSVPISLIKPNNPRIYIEENHQDYLQKLRNMTPAELSGHAIELEKRAIQLTRAADKELARRTALSIDCPNIIPQRVPKFK